MGILVSVNIDKNGAQYHVPICPPIALKNEEFSITYDFVYNVCYYYIAYILIDTCF